MGEGPQAERDALSQLDKMSARLEQSEADIELLQRRAGQASRRARVDERQFEQESRRVDRLESRTEVDHQMIIELQADGLLAREHAANLEAALQTSRMIGAAVGIIMVFYGVPEAGAFDILKQASDEGNFRLRFLAEEVVLAGNVSVLPGR